MTLRLYTCTGAPSPARVTIFVAEKGLQLECVEIDLRSGEHLSDGFAAKSPDCTVPVLELADGTCLWNSQAIRQYLESLHPEPPLLGHDALTRALVTQWVGWVEHNGLLAAAEAFRNRVAGMRDHAVPGRRPVAQIPALAERGRQRFGYFLEDLDARLRDSPRVATDELTVADIDAWVTVRFGCRVSGHDPNDYPAVSRWMDELSTRPAFAAHSE
ncbi:MAG: glutathione S-transferase [Wenzhouxiangellaceae bacterium]